MKDVMKCWDDWHSPTCLLTFNQWDLEKCLQTLIPLPPLSFFLSLLLTVLAFMSTWRTLTGFCALGCCHCFNTQAQVALPWWKGTRTNTARRTLEAVLPLSRCPLNVNETSLWKSTLISPWETLVGDYKTSVFPSRILALNFNGDLGWLNWEQSGIR